MELPTNGSGYYCINSNGNAYSHSDAHVHSKKSSFGFETGDALSFEYDSIKGKMIVAKNNRERYEMDVEKDAAERYAFCAYFYD